MENGTYTLENGMAASTKLNILLPWDPEIILFSIQPKELKTCPHKNMHMDIYSSLIHKCQKLEEPKLSFNRWMDK